MSKFLTAEIHFVPPIDGGRVTPAMDGIRPQIKAGSFFTSCVVHAEDGTRTFTFGTIYRVRLEIVFWSEYGHLLQDCAALELFEGSRLIAKGRLLPEHVAS